MNYIDNEKLLEEVKIYSESGIKTEELGRMLLLLATRYSEKGNFAGYSWKDDMIGEAVFTCLRYMHNFNIEIENPNPFAYFSIVIHRSFLNYIQKQKKHSKIKDICYKHIDFITPDGVMDDEYSYFNIHGINYQPIRGDKKKKRRKRKKK